MYAVRDHDMSAHIKSHPEDFPEKDKKTYGEILEEFHRVHWSLQKACSGFTDAAYFWILWNCFYDYLKFMLIYMLCLVIKMVFMSKKKKR